MHPAVESALEEAFPGRTPAGVDPRASRPGNRTVAVRFEGGGRAFLKIATDGDGGRVARDAAATRYAGAHCDVRVPEVLASAPDGDPPYVATAPLDGDPIADRWPGAGAEGRARILRSVGRALAGVHAARFDRPGRIVGGDAGGLDLDGGSWTGVLRATLRERASVLFADRFDDLLERVDGALDEHSARLDGAPAVLLHDDARPENYFRHPGGPGLIDWETALVGDPALDLCRAESQFVDRQDVDDGDRRRLRSALRGGYRDRAGDLPDGFNERRPVYRAVTFLRTARTFDLWAPPADEPTAELADWVRGEMDRRLDEFR